MSMAILNGIVAGRAPAPVVFAVELLDCEPGSSRGIAQALPQPPESAKRGLAKFCAEAGFLD